MCMKDEAKRFLLFADLVTPSQGQGNWKWYEFRSNGAYNYGTYEQILLKSLHVMSSAKVFAMQLVEHD